MTCIQPTLLSQKPIKVLKKNLRRDDQKKTKADDFHWRLALKNVNSLLIVRCQYKVLPQTCSHAANAS